MLIPIFRVTKGEDLKIFLREYKKTCIGTGLITTIKLFNFFLEFLEGITSH
jgi:hypothetical protein